MTCPQCSHPFTPSKYAPDQRFCVKACQERAWLDNYHLETGNHYHQEYSADRRMLRNE